MFALQVLQRFALFASDRVPETLDGRPATLADPFLDFCQFLSSPVSTVFPVSRCIGSQNKAGGVVGVG
jgi:hypothetical protein